MAFQGITVLHHYQQRPLLLFSVQFSTRAASIRSTRKRLHEPIKLLYYFIIQIVIYAKSCFSLSHQGFDSRCFTLLCCDLGFVVCPLTLRFTFTTHATSERCLWDALHLTAVSQACPSLIKWHAWGPSPFPDRLIHIAQKLKSTYSVKQAVIWLAGTFWEICSGFFSVRLHAKLRLQDTGVDITSAFEDKITSGFAKVSQVSGNCF